MWDIIERLVALFCIIVFLTFMINHGHIDFSGVDWIVGKSKEVVTSEEGQQYINETKEISKNVFSELFSGVKNIFSKDSSSSSEKNNNHLESVPLEEAQFISVVDENTIKLLIKGEEKNVNLLGLKGLDDTYSSSAKEYISAIFGNVNKVFLEYDVTNEDPDGNILAYVWISDSVSADISNNMINALIIKNGYGVDTVYIPNTKYTDNFISLKKDAFNNKKGLWSDEEFNKTYMN